MEQTLEINPVDIINDLQEKLSDAEMRATYANAQVKALAARYQELQQQILDQQQANMEGKSSLGPTQSHDVVDGEIVGGGD